MNDVIERIKEKVLLAPSSTHLRQKVTKFLGEYYWTKQDFNTNIMDHITLISKQVNSQDEFLELMMERLKVPLPLNILWEIILIENYEDDKSIIVPRFNHILGDALCLGITMCKMNDDYDGIRQRMIPLSWRIKFLVFLTLPFYLTFMNIKLFVLARRPTFGFMEHNITHQSALTLSPPINMNTLKSVAQNLHITINDLLTGIILMGSRRYFMSKRSKALPKEITMAVPMSFRPTPTEKRPLIMNVDVGTMVINFPFNEINDLSAEGKKEFQEISKIYSNLKKSLYPAMSYYIWEITTKIMPCKLVCVLMEIVQTKLQAIISNIAGAPKQWHLHGRKLIHMYGYYKNFGNLVAIIVRYLFI